MSTVSSSSLTIKPRFKIYPSTLYDKLHRWIIFAGRALNLELGTLLEIITIVRDCCENTVVCVLQPAAIKSNVKFNCQKSCWQSQQPLHVLVSVFLAPFSYLRVDLQTPLYHRPTQHRCNGFQFDCSQLLPVLCRRMCCLANNQRLTLSRLICWHPLYIWVEVSWACIETSAAAVTFLGQALGYNLMQSAVSPRCTT